MTGPREAVSEQVRGEHGHGPLDAALRIDTSSQYVLLVNGVMHGYRSPGGTRCGIKRCELLMSDDETLLAKPSLLVGICIPALHEVCLNCWQPEI